MFNFKVSKTLTICFPFFEFFSKTEKKIAKIFSQYLEIHIK